MKEGLLKDLAFALKNQYDKYDKKMFFVIFYGTISQVSIFDIKNFEEFIKNSPIDMIHIHMCDSGDYIDVYEWEIEDFEVNDVFVSINNKGKESKVYYYDMPNKICLKSKLFAIQFDSKGNLLEHNFVVPYNYFGNYALKDEEGKYFQHCFRMEYLNKVVEIPDYGYFLFFTKEKYKNHMKGRLLVEVMENTRKKTEQETKLLEKALKYWIGENNCDKLYKN